MVDIPKISNWAANLEMYGECHRFPHLLEAHSGSIVCYSVLEDFCSVPVYTPMFRKDPEPAKQILRNLQLVVTGAF